MSRDIESVRARLVSSGLALLAEFESEARSRSVPVDFVSTHSYPSDACPKGDAWDPACFARRLNVMNARTNLFSRAPVPAQPYTPPKFGPRRNFGRRAGVMLCITSEQQQLCVEHAFSAHSVSVADVCSPRAGYMRVLRPYVGAARQRVRAERFYLTEYNVGCCLGYSQVSCRSSRATNGDLKASYGRSCLRVK
eukprot:4464945-Pleurochrysis_carterae.AAC.5